MNMYMIAQEIIDRNIIVYDSDSDKGELTCRLLALLDDVAYRNRIGTVSDIYIPNGVKYDEYLFNGRRLFGELDVKIDEDSKKMATEVEKYYLKGGGVLPSSRANLVFAYCRDTEQYLGGSC
jgi:hypothetical protein